MAMDDNDVWGPFDPLRDFPVPPGVDIESVGPLGVPMPVPGEAEQPADQPEPVDATEDDQSVPDPGDPLDEAIELGESYIDRVEEAMETETCSFCLSVLQDLRGEPMDEQVQGVRELKRLKDVMATDPDREKLKDVMGDFEVVELPGVDA
jgi:hypothetical protein